MTAPVSGPLEPALDRLRAMLLEPDTLIRAVASGRRRGAEARWRRADLRYVDLKAGRRLQVVTYDDTQAFTANHPPGPEAADAVASLLSEPFSNWVVTTTDTEQQLRVTKKGEALVSSTRREQAAPVDRGHDRAKQRMLPEDHPVLLALGISGADGNVKASRRAKYRQVEEFVRLLDAALSEALEAGHLRAPTPEDPLRIADLGCGNAYLTFAALAHLRDRGLAVRLVGVDTKAQAVEHGAALASQLGYDNHGVTEFRQGSIDEVEIEPPPEVVLSLHACDTATDDALARAASWGAAVVLAAPCCHHDVAAQLRRSPAPPGHAALTRDGILRERLADTLTDALRASVLRLSGYRVDVVEFVGSEHTPRNTLLRAVRTDTPPTDAARQDLDLLTSTWHVRPRLAELLHL